MLRNLRIARVKMAGISFVLTVVGAGLVLRGTLLASQPPNRQGPSTAPAAAERPHPNLVGLSDEPFPKHARARLGNLRFHSGGHVGTTLYTPDGKSLVTLDIEGRRPNRLYTAESKSLVTLGHSMIQVWDAATGRTVRDIGDSTINFRAIALSPDGKTVATTEYPSRLRLWDVVTGRERRRWHQTEHDGNWWFPAFSPDGQTLATLSARYDGTFDPSKKFIALWDVTAPSERRRLLRGDWFGVWDLKFSPDGKTLATATDDTEIDMTGQKVGPETTSIRLWELTSGRERKRFAVAGFQVQSLAFSADGKLLAAGVQDQTVRVYDLATEQERMPRLGQEHALEPEPPLKPGSPPLPPSPGPQPWLTTCLAFSPDGSILAAGSAGPADGNFYSLAAIHLWAVARGRELRQIPGHQRRINSLSFSPDGRTLASSGGDPLIRLWSVATGRDAFQHLGHQSAVRAVAVSPADGTVFTGGHDGTVRRWDPASGRELGVVAPSVGSVRSLAVAPDGETLLVGAWTGDLALWSVGERREIRRYPGTGAAEHAVYSPDGKSVAYGRRLWDAVSGQRLAVFPLSGEPNDLDWPYVFYSPDGTQVISAGRGGVWVFDVASEKEVRHAIRSDSIHGPVRLSPDGRLLAMGGVVSHFRGSKVDPPIRVWELASGQQVATLDGHEETTNGLDFSPDGKLLVSGSGDGGTSHDATVRVWDVATGRELRRFEGHKGGVNAVAFMRDGRSVVSGSEDATALVWDVADLKDRSEPVTPLAPEALLACWNELASNDARAAYRATQALSVPSAVPFLRDHLRPASAAEPVHDVAITSPEMLRTLRAIASLERVNTLDARRVIELMANGNADVIATRQAKSTRDRLSRKLRR
jgi:WD40 repeat protein